MSKHVGVVVLVTLLSFASIGSATAAPAGDAGNTPATAAPSAAPAPVPGGVFSVEDPWIQLGADDALAWEGEAKLVNHSDSPVRIIGITSRGFRMGVIERVILQDGIPRNAMVSSLTIPPGETVQLDSKNYHFMLLGPKTKYKEGDQVKVQLQFQDRDPAVVVFAVSAKPPVSAVPPKSTKRKKPGKRR